MRSPRPPSRRSPLRAVLSRSSPSRGATRLGPRPRATSTPTDSSGGAYGATVPTSRRRSPVLSSLRNMFKVPDLRNKILFTLLIIAVYRFGSHIPTPGVDFQAVQDLEEQARSGGVLGFLSFFSGGALTRFAIFGLGIMPYITSSIIMQVLTVVIPKLEQWQQQGAVGQKKITQWTRYLTVVLAIIQSTGLAFLFHNGASQIFGTDIDLIPEWNIPRVMLIVLSLTAGTALIMWMGELITQRGIGNGMSLVIFSSVVSGIPGGGAQVKAEGGMVKFLIVVALAIGVLVAIVFV